MLAGEFMPTFFKRDHTKFHFFNKTTNLQDLLAKSLSITHLSERILIEDI